MKKVLVFVLAAIMVISALPAAAVYADEIPAISYSDHLTNNSNVGYDYDITDASIAWVKQANGALIWVTDDDNRGNDEIIAQAKAADPSLNNAVSDFAVLKGLGTASTPNSHGSQAVITVTVTESNGKTIMSINGKYSHFVSGSASGDASGDSSGSASSAASGNSAVSAESEATAPVEGEKVSVRIDTPLKMAVAFEDGTIYYGGEMKEVVFGKEYLFQMCSVNWENGLFDDDDNGLRGTVVFRMTVVHQNEFKELAQAAKENPDRYTVKGIDIIDNVDKKIIVNGDASDTHLETDVNNFFVAYRFHFTGSDYNKKTGIDKVVNNPLESLSVNLPLGSTITCKAFIDGELVNTDDVFITTNSGVGIYDDEFLTSVNDYTWE